MSDKTPLIKLRAVSFGSILREIDLEITSQQILTIIGPNGAGKTTLLKIVLGLIRGYQGQVERQTNLKIGYMPQKIFIDKTLPVTVERFLSLSAHKNLTLEQTLNLVGAQHLQHSSLHVLSGGELQRILLARAVIGCPDLLVLDEPVQGVDITGQGELYHVIQSLRERFKCGILLVSHDLHFVHAASDHVICLNQHICCQGHPELIQSDPAYEQLFGSKISLDLVPYRHRHDHRHA